MKNLIGSMIAVAGLAAAANAGTSTMDVQVSKDGVNWADSVMVNRNAGDSGRVLVRYVMTWTPSATTDVVPIAFASLTFQPTFTNPRIGVDTVAPFANAGNNLNGGAIDVDGSPTDGPFGRLKPFASTGPAATNPASSGNSYAVHTHTGGSGGAPASDYYRIARNDITRWAGTGPTSGATAVNNFNGAGGVACVQKSSGNVNQGVDPAFRAGIVEVEIMRLALDTGTIGNGLSHTILAEAPTGGMSRATTGTAIGQREASWFASSSDNAGSVKAPVTVHGGEIIIVPAPGALALLGLGGLIAGRRRNR